MKYFVSKDGTNIAYERSGMGPPLVLVHGTGVDHTYWDLLIPELAQSFTVYTVDRRGRGHSGDTLPYAIQREFADVAALAESISGEVNLLGHSYGALCSLEAVLLTKNIRKLILYEPPMYVTIEVPYLNIKNTLNKFDALMQTGDAEQALLMLYEVGQTSARELDLLRSQSNWQARILAAHTVPREVISVTNYSFDADRFSELKVSTLFLLGSESPSYYKATTHTLHASLPRSRIDILPKQGHEAVVTAPELFLREVACFFLGDT